MEHLCVCGIMLYFNLIFPASCSWRPDYVNCPFLIHSFVKKLYMKQGLREGLVLVKELKEGSSKYILYTCV
jgi:hypothetical protein